MTTKDLVEYAYLKNIKKWMYCPKCNDARSRLIINKDKTLWVCENCGYRLSSKEFENDMVFWFCDECGTYMNIQKGFTEKEGIWVCEKCNCLNDVEYDNIKGACKYCGVLIDDPDKTICTTCKEVQFDKWMNRISQIPEVLDSINDVIVSVDNLDQNLRNRNNNRQRVDSQYNEYLEPEYQTGEYTNSSGESELSVCENCGVKFDREFAAADFETDYSILNYNNFKKCLCGECAVSAIEDDEDGIYFEKCEICDKTFDYIEDRYRFEYNEGGLTLTDLWNCTGKIMCCDCAMDACIQLPQNEDDEYYEDDKEEGCIACGNPVYPNCKDSCSMFDD